MKYWFGYLTAAIFGAITWVLLQFGEKFTNLVDMVYPYVIRNVQNYLAQWTSVVEYPVWQLLAVMLAVLILEKDCTPEALYAEIRGLLSDDSRREAMRRKLYELVRLDSAERICDIMEKLMKDKQGQ